MTLKIKPSIPNKAASNRQKGWQPEARRDLKLKKTKQIERTP